MYFRFNPLNHLTNLYFSPDHRGGAGYAEKELLPRSFQRFTWSHDKSTNHQSFLFDGENFISSVKGFNSTGELKISASVKVPVGSITAINAYNWGEQNKLVVVFDKGHLGEEWTDEWLRPRNRSMDQVEYMVADLAELTSFIEVARRLNEKPISVRIPSY